MTREQEIKYIFENKDVLIAQKKAVMKRGDGVFSYIENPVKTEVMKAGIDITDTNPTALKARLVINTTNIIDSHMDCHIPGLWKKSIQENKVFFLLQEHEMEFANIIADSVNNNLTATAEKIAWSKLNYPFSGTTEALMFNVSIGNRNEFMFDQYAKGYVLNHSVGMRYVKLYLCINSNEANYSTEKDNWDKYYSMVANQDVADEKGFFWAVTEAKFIEGSAVVKGSNEATPVMEIEIEEPEKSTPKAEPQVSTLTKSELKLLIKQILS